LLLELDFNKKSKKKEADKTYLFSSQLFIAYILVLKRQRIMSASGEASSSMSTDGAQTRLGSSANMQPTLTPALVSAWLDAHPDFLNDYLKKLQLQRRTSIMSDKSSHLLASLHSNLISYNRSHFSQSASLLANEAPPSPLTSASASLYALNRTPSVFECGKRLSNVNEYQSSASSINMTSTGAATTTSATAMATPTAAASALSNSNNSSAGANGTATSATAQQQSGLNSQFTFTPAAFNLSFSEPNLQPAARAQLAQQQHMQLQQLIANTASPFATVSSQQSQPTAQQQQQLQQGQQHQQQQQLVPRKKFKQLSLYEKMYTLVKTLYQSLDLKSTCKKILNTVSLLLDADRCSLFLVVDDEKAESKKCLVSVVFDAQSNSDLLIQNNIEMNERELEQARERSRKRQQLCSDGNGSSEDECESSDADGHQIKIEYGRGIAGWVAQTGQSLNIEDAYEDSRFNSTIDKQTGYRTRSILCLPIMNECGQCIAVAEAINKLNDNDELASQSSSSSSSSSNNMTYCFTKQDEEVIF
jgi:hypothetical protein